MLDQLMVVLGVIFIMIGILCILRIQKVSKKVNGLIYINKDEGVYFQAFEDPMGYQDGQKIVLEVCLVDNLPGQSQEEQGRE